MLASVFIVTVIAELMLAGLLIVSWVAPGRRVWPPPGRDTWQFRAIWGLTLISTVGVLLTGILDWNSGPFVHEIRLPVGLLMMLCGLLFARWGMTTLGRHATFGLEGTLVESGPYRWTRNPQYVGDILALLGWGILCNSLPTWIVSILGAGWFALAPFTEEPWLRLEYGEAYDAYRQRLPRYLGRPSAGRP
ncbi:MAG: hypothetical protein GY946_32880 [bacterium]|nr:hypothetical protein [bacterium]